MRIALVNPADRTTAGYHSSNEVFAPLGLQVLARRTPPGHQVTLYDEVCGPTRFTKHLREGRFDLVAVTAMTCGAARAYELGVRCRQYGVPSIIGGIHASACPDEAAQFFDSVATGECDDIWAGIVADAADERLAPSYHGGLANLSGDGGRADTSLKPEKARHKYNMMSIQTSRGCPCGCSYCSVSAFNGRQIRRRNVDSLIEEWNAAPKTRGAFIVDDNFFGLSRKDNEWAKMFCEELIRRGRKRIWFSQTTVNMGDDAEALRLAYRAGCRIMLIGFESFNEQSLKAYKKGLNRRNVTRYRELVEGYHRAGIAVFGAFIAGADEDTEQTAETTRQMAREIGIDVLQITSLTPLPGTELYDQLLREGRLLTAGPSADWSRHTFAETIFQPKRMTPEELERSIWRMRCRSFRNPHTLLRTTLRTLWNTRSLSTALMVHEFNTGYRDIVRSFAERDRARFEAPAAPLTAPAMVVAPETKSAVGAVA